MPRLWKSIILSREHLHPAYEEAYIKTINCSMFQPRLLSGPGDNEAVFDVILFIEHDDILILKHRGPYQTGSIHGPRALPDILGVSDEFTKQLFTSSR